MPVNNGTAGTITFGTSGFTASITNINWDGIERASLPTSHLGTTTAHTFIPGDLYDPGEISLDIQFDPDDFPPISAVAETITVTYPLTAGATTAANWASTGFLTGASHIVPLEALMTGTITVKLSGAITPTDEV